MALDTRHRFLIAKVRCNVGYGGGSPEQRDPAPRGRARLSRGDARLRAAAARRLPHRPPNHTAPQIAEGFSLEEAAVEKKILCVAPRLCARLRRCGSPRLATPPPPSARVRGRVHAATPATPTRPMPPDPRAEKVAVNAFFEPSGPGALRWYYQVRTGAAAAVSASQPALRGTRTAPTAWLQAGWSRPPDDHTPPPQVPEEKGKDGFYVPKGTRPQLYLGTQQVRHAGATAAW